tara:strand:- start:2273 stop:2893 length:621 start_codon:yes stop_codon:yes gene_type:complete
MASIQLFLGNSLEFFETPIGIISFISLYAIWVTILLPGLWPSMLGGFLYGSIFGSIFVSLGAFIGAELTFLCGRKYFRNWIQNRISKFQKFKAIQKSITKEGLKLVILTRISPIFPFSLLNLIYSLSEVSFRNYTLGLIGIFPGTILYCSLGSLAGDIAKFTEVASNRKDIASLALTSLGFIATFFVVYFISRAARNALQEFDSSG